ncbi:MAG: hypothetical protein M3436_08410 [Pseudomonadota bacterium]|nr:hypothetical protein [Pseudomonadota bacterium]
MGETASLCLLEIDEVARECALALPDRAQHLGHPVELLVDALELHHRSFLYSSLEIPCFQAFKRRMEIRERSETARKAEIDETADAQELRRGDHHEHTNVLPHLADLVAGIGLQDHLLMFTTHRELDRFEARRVWSYDSGKPSGHLGHIRVPGRKRARSRRHDTYMPELIQRFRQSLGAQIRQRWLRPHR